MLFFDEVMVQVSHAAGEHPGVKMGDGALVAGGGEPAGQDGV